LVSHRDELDEVKGRADELRRHATRSFGEETDRLGLLSRRQCSGAQLWIDVHVFHARAAAFIQALLDMEGDTAQSIICHLEVRGPFPPLF
jgi:hypothetical protein